MGIICGMIGSLIFLSLFVGAIYLRFGMDGVRELSFITNLPVAIVGQIVGMWVFETLNRKKQFKYLNK
jgi:ABC-type Fe3+-siderophore transport system permease subunit